MKISETSGGIGRPRLLDVNDQLGRASAVLGDVDGDGVPDIAAAGHADDDGGLDVGAAYVMLLRRDGRAKASTKLSMLSGGFTGVLHDEDNMGRAIAGPGDIDGDGIPDIAMGANFDDEGGQNKGSVYVCFLNRDGSARTTVKIGTNHGILGLRSHDQFGRALADIGDFDKDGVPDLAVGAPYDDDGGENKGAVYLVLLNRDASVKGQFKISQLRGGFRGRLDANDVMAFGLCSIGDLDGNGVVDLAAGANLDDDGAINAGAVWIIFLNADGTVLREQKISMLAGGFTGVLGSPFQFGDAVSNVGDLDGDGITDIAVGAVKDGDVGTERGAVWILFLNRDGTVKGHQKISQVNGTFPFRLDDFDWLGASVGRLGDLDLDGIPDLLVGARNDDDGGPNQGAVYVCYLRGVRTALVADDARPERPEPELRRVSGVPAVGERVGLLLENAYLPAGAEPKLLLGRLLRRAADATGFALEPRALVREFAAGRVFAFDIPNELALVGATFWTQAAWLDRSAQVRGVGAPYELLIQR